MVDIEIWVSVEETCETWIWDWDWDWLQMVHSSFGARFDWHRLDSRFHRSQSYFDPLSFLSCFSLALKAWS
jgi:hypothetical protein